jgi:hypothetical protein
VRVIILTFIVCTLLAAMAVQGLDFSSRHSARPQAPPGFEIQSGATDNRDHGGVEPSPYAR